jgi:hypothetical protein
LVKFLITVIAALILLGFSQTLASLGDLAANATLSLGELRDLEQSPALHSGGGVLVLLGATIIAVYKPWGMTRYGRRKQQLVAVGDLGVNTFPSWKRYLLLGTIALVLAFLVLHLLSGGARGH